MRRLARRLERRHADDEIERLLPGCRRLAVRVLRRYSRELLGRSGVTAEDVALEAAWRLSLRGGSAYYAVLDAARRLLRHGLKGYLPTVPDAGYYLDNPEKVKEIRE